MVQKKVCMLGASSVGKTSLVRKFVSSDFGERYQTSIGVKVDKKTVRVSDNDVTMVLWDLYGEDQVQKIQLSYLRGCSGYLLVADGTRPTTLDGTLSLQQKVSAELGNIPFLLLLNKSDLVETWAIDDDAMKRLADYGWPVLRSSAKTGEGVEEAFLRLAMAMLSIG